MGNGQLEVRDVEAVFPMNRYDVRDIDYYLRNVTHYLLELDRDMQTGEDIDGPDETNLTWAIEVLDEGVIEPPRNVLRLCPKASGKAVGAALSNIGRP